MDHTAAIRTLYNVPEAQQYALPEQQLTALEARMGVPLPETLMRYYRSLGDNGLLNQSHNRLLQPDEVACSDDGYLVFYEEHQAVVYWGIKKEDLVLGDPPVWGNYGSEERPDWIQESPSLGDFWLLMAVYNGTMGALPYNANAMGTIDQAVIAAVQQSRMEMTTISWERQKVYTDSFLEVISLSFDPDGNCTAVFIGTAHRERFDNLLDTLPVDWDYTSDEDWDDEEEEA